MTDPVTAVHEGSHAVVGVAFGFDIASVRVHQPGTHDTELGRCENASWRQDLNADPVRVLCYVLAGPIGERRFTSRPSARDVHDREKAAGIAAMICELDDTQHPRAVALVKAAEAMATALVYDPIIWRAIERVAAALQRTGALSGRDVALMLREAKQ